MGLWNISSSDANTGLKFRGAINASLDAIRVWLLSKDAVDTDLMAKTAANTADIATLKTTITNLQLNINNTVGMIGVFSGDVAPDGWLRVDTGALVSRMTYPNLWAFANTSLNIVSDSEWLAQIGANKGICGRFSYGDGSTNFRTPSLGDVAITFKSVGRGIGTYEPDHILSHSHTSPGFTTGAEWGYGDVVHYSNMFFIGDMSRSTGSTGSTENTIKNIAYLPCIKY